MAERQSTKVFISYSRKDIEFAQRLVDRLRTDGIEVWIDWEQLAPGADWQKEIEKGVANSSAFIVILSPDAMRAETIKQEISVARANGKRIIPILHREVEYQDVPIEVASINWVFMRFPQDDFESGFAKVLEALRTDPEWLEASSRLQNLALELSEKGREESYLLRGKNYSDTMQAVS